jgi:uncharacterized RDD family membrane protein YckC
MSQPPDDRGRMPWDPAPGDGPEDPTVPWTAPDATPPPPPPLPGTGQAPGWVPPAPPTGPVGWGTGGPAPNDPAAIPPTPGQSAPGTPFAPPADPAASAGLTSLDPIDPAVPPVATPAAGGPLLSSAPSAPAVAWATPAAAAAEVAPGLTYADTGTRVVGYIVDSILIGIIVSIVGGATGLLRMEVVDGITTPVGGLAYNVLGLVVGAVYFILSWSGGRRATLGQRLFKIQVGNAVDGRALTTEQAVRRWFGYGLWISLLAVTPTLSNISVLASAGWALTMLITTATSPTKQGIHDRIANSMAVRPTNAGNGAAMACLVIVGLLVILSVVAIVALIFLGGQVSSILSAAGESI